MNPSKYTYFYEFTDDIVKSELRRVIKDKRELIKIGSDCKSVMDCDKAVLDAAKVLLRYYS